MAKSNIHMLDVFSMVDYNKKIELLISWEVLKRYLFHIQNIYSLHKIIHFSN